MGEGRISGAAPKDAGSRDRTAGVEPNPAADERHRLSRQRYPCYG